MKAKSLSISVQPGTKEIEMLRLDQLEFDRDNPRLPKRLKKKPANEIIAYLVRDAALPDLMRAIGEMGYFPGEPILVKRKSDGRYVVVEGNRRFCACLLLSNPNLATVRQATIQALAADAAFRPTVVPALVYDDRSEILKYLGYRHITGVYEWGSIEKARYLRQLYDAESGSSDERLKHVARAIGSKAPYIGRLLTGLLVFEYAQKQKVLPSMSAEAYDNLEFSLLTTAVNYKNIATFIGIKSLSSLRQSFKRSHVAELIRWLYQEEDGITRLGESRQLKKLNQVVARSSALKALRGGTSLEEAYSLVAEGAGELDRALTLALNYTIRARGLLRNHAVLTEEEVSSVERLAKQAAAMLRTVTADDSE